MDQVYVMAYVLIFVSILEVIVTAYWINRDEETWVRRVMWADLTFLSLQIVIMATGLTWLITRS
jgi:hypothetical protein